METRDTRLALASGPGSWQRPRSADGRRTKLVSFETEGDQPAVAAILRRRGMPLPFPRMS